MKQKGSHTLQKKVHKDGNGHSILSILGLRPNPQIPEEIKTKNDYFLSKMGRL